MMSTCDPKIDAKSLLLSNRECYEPNYDLYDSCASANGAEIVLSNLRLNHCCWRTTLLKPDGLEG
jgi:hypothetical protein